MANEVPIARGGTGASTKELARLGLGFPATASRYLRNDGSGVPSVVGANESVNLDWVAATGPVDFGTRTLAAAWTPASAPPWIRTAGYSSVGDGGGALYKYVVAEPSYAGKLSVALSGGGTAWYELAATAPTPEMFGAVADWNGVTGTLNTASLQAFIDYCADKRVTGRLLGGRYLSGPLTIKNTVSRKYHGLILEGCGAGINAHRSEIVFNQPNGINFLIDAQDGAYGTVQLLDRVVIRNISFRCANTTFTGTMMRIRRVYDISIENCYFVGANTVIDTPNTTDRLIDGNEWVKVKFSNCYFRQAGTGIKDVTFADYTNYVNCVTFDACLWDNCTTSVDLALKPRLIKFIDPVFEPQKRTSNVTNTGPASLVYVSGYDVVIDGGYCGDANDDGTWIWVDGERGVISKMDISSGHTGIKDSTAYGCTIEDNSINAAAFCIDLEATKGGAVRRNRIALTHNGSVGIAAGSGLGYVIEDNDCSLADAGMGFPTSTVGYFLGAGTTGNLRDLKYGTVATPVSNLAAAGAWLIEDVDSRSLMASERQVAVSVGDIPAASAYELTLSVNVAATGDCIVLTPPSALDGSILIGAPRVSVAGTVKATLYNTSGAAKNPSGTWRVRVLKATL